jgi:LacI family transcriptional regulator
MATQIRDIAADAQVSVATVSRVLNGSRTVNEALRVRVVESVARLGYQPNVFARSLRLHKSFVLGVIIPSITNPFFTAVARAVEDTALEAGYAVAICSSDQDMARERRYLDVLRNRMVDGALVTVADRQSSDLAPLLQSGMPVVLVDRCLTGVTLDSVTVDTRRGAYMAVEHLLGRGYRRIGLVGGPPHVSTAVSKLEGFRQALTDHGLPIEADLMVAGEYTDASGYEAGARLLGLRNPPEAVVVANNQMTLGFFRLVRERCLRVPQEMAFIGFDDAPWAALVVPPVTVIDQPTYDLGRCATELLLERLDGGRREIRHAVLPTRLIVRGSC